MGRVFKWLLYILILAAAFLVLYAYIGPFLGVDFSAQQDVQTIPVTLSTD